MGPFLLFLLVLVSCTTTDKITNLAEDTMYITRKYVGVYQEYRFVVRENWGDPNICFVKTTQDSIYGKIGVQSKIIKYEFGELLYINRKYISYPNSLFGRWVYQLESSNSKYVYSIIRFTKDRYKELDNAFKVF